MSGVYSDNLEMGYTSEGFPKGRVLGSGNLQTNWDELIWAAITIGRPNTAYVFQHGDASLYEALFRLSLVRMALDQRPFSPSLHRTNAFRALDPTEKGAVSYFLGMAVCKLFASRLLNTHWLLHLDVFRDQLNPAILGKRSRPDMVGQNASGKWHAFESKGRSGMPSKDDKQKAKAQAWRLISVGGTRCSLHIGSFVYFRQNKLEFFWCDPEPDEPEKLEPIRLRLSDDAWAAYYAPALGLASLGPSEAAVAPLDDLDVKVEVHPKLHDLLLETRWADARRLAGQLQHELRKNGYQADGLKIVAGESWRRPSKG